MLLFDDVSATVDDPYLARALDLAGRGRGRTAPNPVVGCLVVRDGVVVGEGHHPRAGQPHAEVFALAEAGELARGADVYVTLEPCAHHGRTPPCVDALIAAGVRSVTIGMRDPNPEAHGGIERLRRAGVEVVVNRDAEPFARVNAGWLKRLAIGLPAVTVKVGASLDGSLAMREGERSSMTGSSGADVTRRLRDRSDAVLVGASTVVIDDPALTVRDPDGRHVEHQPLRIVLARTSLPPSDARVFTDGDAPTMLLVPPHLEPGTARRRFGETVVVPYDVARGLEGALAALGRHGVNDLLIEAGPRLLAGLLHGDAIDRLVVVTAGGFAGRGSVRMYDAAGQTQGDDLTPRFAAIESAVVGDVAVTVWERSSAHVDV